MQDFFDLLKYVLPSLVVFGTAYYLIQMMLNGDANRRKAEMSMANRKISTPLRLQAYERLALFLERIALNSLIIRTAKADMTAVDLQRSLLANIRHEFEHNLSQQIYVSDASWESVKMAKENTIKIINKVADSVPKDVPAMELSKKIFSVIMQAETSPSELALAVIKNDARTLL